VNRSLALLVAAALGLSAFAAACASETVGASTGATEPEATSSSGGDVGDPNDDPNGDDDQPQGGPNKGDAGPNKGDAGPNKGDAGSQKEAGPPGVTKTEIQALFDARCAPCHIGSASAGLSLANDFTTSTVGVASTQVPNMKRIAPGDKDASYLFHKLRGTHQTVGGSGMRMPRTGPPFLSDADIDRVGAFIDAL
jgi:hypothetical protein